MLSICWYIANDSQAPAGIVGDEADLHAAITAIHKEVFAIDEASEEYIKLAGTRRAANRILHRLIALYIAALTAYGS